MSDPRSATSRPIAAPAAGGQEDWPAKAADAIEQAVATVRDRTTGPAITVARAIVYGLFATFAGLTVLVLGLVAAVRLLDAYLPDAVFGESHTWAAHLVLGVLLCIAALALWRARHRPREA